MGGTLEDLVGSHGGGIFPDSIGSNVGGKLEEGRGDYYRIM